MARCCRRSALRSSKRLRIRLHAASAAWRARQRRDNILQPVQPSQQDFRGRKVFVCHECKSDSLYACLVDMEVTTCLTEADVIVVTSVLPKSMKKKVLWGAMLVGAYLVTSHMFYPGLVQSWSGEVQWGGTFLAPGDGVRTFPRVAPCIDGVVGGCLYTA